jgi:hypothetical protein
MVQGQLLFMDILWSFINARPIVFIPPGYLHYLESVDAEKQLILSYSLGMNDQKT